MIDTTICGERLEFETSRELFSPSAADRGTLAMLTKVEFHPDDRVLDLGCGYGVVGILAARLIGPDRVTMCDISADAVEYARRNALRNGVGEVEIIQSDGVENIKRNDYTLILSNPPYQADFSVPKRFIERGFYRLSVGGEMYMVTKRREWYKNKLISVFGGVKIDEIDGYLVFMAQKKSEKPARKKI